MTGNPFVVLNGINGTRGAYGVRPMRLSSLKGIILGEEPREIPEQELLKGRNFWAANQPFVAKAGVDVFSVGEAGWGAIFPAQGVDPAVKEALQPLLNWRREQAQEHFYVFEGTSGFRSGKDNKASFLSRQMPNHAGPIDPDRFPYYALIVGDPEQIPFSFQYQLGVQANVGRIYFETAEEYARYAEAVVRVEKEKLALPRRMRFFASANQDDAATELSAKALVGPLLERYRAAPEAAGWDVAGIVGEAAQKSALSTLLTTANRPAVLFTATHGMEFDLGDPRQVAHQGALLCQDWPGPRSWRNQGPIPDNFYYAADDLAGDADLTGMIALFFACYGAGTPLLDDFAKQAWKERMPIAERAFVARLPQKLLSRGALAVVGHVERAWSYSFQWPGDRDSANDPNNVETFASNLSALLLNQPIGEAMNYFDQRYAAIATALLAKLEDADFGIDIDPYELVGLWTANNDARGYVLLGDPAVRLPVGEPEPADATAGTAAPVEVSGAAASGATPDVDEAEAPEPADATAIGAVDESGPPPVDSQAAVVVPVGAEVPGRVVDASDALAAIEGPTHQEAGAGPEAFGLRDTARDVSATLREAAEKLAQKISDAVDDLTSLEVRTYTTSDLQRLSRGAVGDAPGTTLRARTRISLDGDLDSLVPVREQESLRFEGTRAAPEIDEQLWQIHRQMVEVAQQSRVEFLKAAAQIAGTLLDALR